MKLGERLNLLEREVQYMKEGYESDEQYCNDSHPTHMLV